MSPSTKSDCPLDKRQKDIKVPAMNYTEKDLEGLFDQLLTYQGMNEADRKTRVQELMNDFVGFFREKYPQGLQEAINNTFANVQQQLTKFAESGGHVH